MIFCHDKTSKAFASTILCPGPGPHPTLNCASLRHLVLFSLPVRRRASSLSSATVRTPESRVGTSGPTAGSWHVLAGAARPLPCAVVRLSPVTLTSKAVSPSQRASAAWTTGSPSISLKVKPSPARRVRVSRSNKGNSHREMD